MTNSKSLSPFFFATAAKHRLGDEQDVIEDSEPEREERRRQWEESRRDGSRSTCSDPQTNQYPHEKRIRGEGENACQCPSTVEHRQQCKVLLPEINRGRCPSPPPITTIEEFLVTEFDEEDQLSHMQLSRFAYQSSSSKRSALPRKPLLPTGSKARNEVKVSRPGVSTERKQVSTSSSWELELPKLLKCVCCSFQWTTKKTARQKKAHLEKCAKKHGIAQDTLQHLVCSASTSALQASLVPSTDVGRTQVHDENITLMNSIVPSEPSRQGKRKQAITTVKSLQETRQAILGKARTILSSSVQPRVEVQGVDQRSPCIEPDDTEPTRQFGESILARRNHFSAQAKETLPESMEVPAATQAFSKSALRGIGSTRNRMFEAYLEASSGTPNIDSGTQKRSLSPVSKDARAVRPRLAQDQ